MKKLWKMIATILVIVAIGVLVFFYIDKNYVKVTVYINETEKVKIYNVHKGKTLKKLKVPTEDGYAFIGWYDLETEELFDLDSKIEKDITLVARWATIISE